MLERERDRDGMDEIAELAERIACGERRTK
jgi:hypothetical protein